MRTCDVCGAEFTPTNPQSKRCSDECRKAAYARTHRAWWDARPEQKAEKSRRAYARYKATTTPEQRRDENLRKKYGIGLGDYEARLAAQGGGCAICQRSEDTLAVDHDHTCCPGERSCGECVRGLLCGPCNRAIGLLGDDVERLRAAIEYLSIRTFYEALGR